MILLFISTFFLRCSPVAAIVRVLHGPGADLTFQSCDLTCQSCMACVAFVSRARELAADHGRLLCGYSSASCASAALKLSTRVCVGCYSLHRHVACRRTTTRHSSGQNWRGRASNANNCAGKSGIWRMSCTTTNCRYVIALVPCLPAMLRGVWCVVCGMVCGMVCGVWCVVRGAWCVVRGVLCGV